MHRNIQIIIKHQLEGPGTLNSSRWMYKKGKKTTTKKQNLVLAALDPNYSYLLDSRVSHETQLPPLPPFPRKASYVPNHVWVTEFRTKI